MFSPAHPLARGWPSFDKLRPRACRGELAEVRDVPFARARAFWVRVFREDNHQCSLQARLFFLQRVGWLILDCARRTSTLSYQSITLPSSLVFLSREGTHVGPSAAVERGPSEGARSGSTGPTWVSFLPFIVRVPRAGGRPGYPSPPTRCASTGIAPATPSHLFQRSARALPRGFDRAYRNLSDPVGAESFESARCLW